MKISTKNEKKMRCLKKNEKMKKNEEWIACINYFLYFLQIALLHKYFSRIFNRTVRNYFEK